MAKKIPSLLLKNGQLATLQDDGEAFGLIPDGSIIVRDGIIEWVGEESDRPSISSDIEIDLDGRLVTPGLIDCHTHLIFAGDRSDEFEARLNGVSYSDIAQAGGGIFSTVRSTRAASEDMLVQTGTQRLLRLASEGVTTVEVKSGYGLDLETECRMLRAARRAGAATHLDVRTTYLGAHMVPPEYTNRRQDYVGYICDEVLPAVVDQDLADAVDGFCEGIAFTTDEMDAIFEAATELNLPVKLHAEQLTDQGGAELAASHGALSVDHLEYLTEDGVIAMARAGSVAVLIPGAFYYLREHQLPPVELLRRYNVPIAVATDLNPGSSPVFSLLTAMNMACVQFSLTVEEVLAGVTCHAASALGLPDRGVIKPENIADLAIWDVARPAQLVYPVGLNPCSGVIKGGEIIAAPEGQVQGA